jgi:RNA polymerase sigma factor (sigma-70 family)
MARGQIASVVRHIRKLIGLQDGQPLSDGELLTRFVEDRDETAFEVLVQRYGSMVNGVCRRILSDSNDADDAFQATFLVLVRRAASLDSRSPLGNWLYGVAYRVALKARANAARRRERERQSIIMSENQTENGPSADVDMREVRTVLDEEIQQLPEKFRAPLVLCYLIGKTNEEAARELGCPPGSMWWRLDRARAMLKDRLSRRGVALPAVGLATLLTEQVQAAVPSALAAATVQTASVYIAGTAASAAQAQVVQLAEGAMRTMFMQKFARITAALSLLFVLAGAGLGAAHLLADKEKPANNLPPVIRSVASGPWSAPATWEGGKVPGAGSRVLVRDGHRIVYDVKSEAVLRGLSISGVVSFDPTKDTRLEVGLIKIQPGDEYSEDGFECEGHMAMPDASKPRAALLVGTPEKPVDVKHTALIRLHYIDGMNKETCPAIVCCGGQMDFHGAALSRAWVKLGETAKAGATEIVLGEAVTGWKVGDRIILTATMRYDDGGKVRGPFTEERFIKAIDGTKLTLDKAVEFPHSGEGEYRGEVANLSRNVVVESADPAGVRGHTMYHKHSAGSLSYAEFRYLGKEGVLGKYALHFHLIGDTMRGSYVVGNSIWDSGNRWLTIHGTNYLIVRDNVGYKSIGHGYFLEDGTEVFNVIDRNLAVGAKRGKRLPKQVLSFDSNDGAGFWWSNSLNTFTRNVAAECGQYGFRYEATVTSAQKLDFPILQPDGSKKTVDIRTLPFVRFDDNEVHSTTGLYGVNLGEGVKRVGPDTKHPFIVRNLKIWNTHYGFRVQIPSLLLDGLTLYRTHYGVYHPNYDNHVYRNVYIGYSNTEPFNRGHDDDSIQYGPLTVDGLTFEGCRSGGMPLIQISDDNPTGTAVTHMRNVKTTNWADSSKDKALVNLGGGPRPTPKTEKGVPVYLHDWYGANQTAMVVSMKSGEYKADPSKYKADAPLTGNESRVAEVKDVPFPKLLEPVDDLPPTTVITSVRRDGNKLTVRGCTADNGEVKRVLVNGKEAKPTAANFAEWEIVLDNVSAGEVKVSAFSEDAAGNVEKLPHVVAVK